HPQVAAALVVARDAEVQADGLGVTDVEVAVRLGRKARDDLGMLSRGEILVDDLPDEVARSATLLDHWQASEWVAGAVGIEPTNGRVRACCLAVWRRPNGRSRRGRIRPMARATVKHRRERGSPLSTALGDEEQAAIAELERSPVERARGGEDAESFAGKEPRKLRDGVDAVADLRGLALGAPLQQAGLEETAGLRVVGIAYAVSDPSRLEPPLRDEVREQGLGRAARVDGPARARPDAMEHVPDERLRVLVREIAEAVPEAVRAVVGSAGRSAAHVSHE